MIVGPAMLIPTANVAPKAPTRAVSSAKIAASLAVPPRPPYSIGQPGAAQPPSNSVRCHLRHFSSSTAQSAPAWKKIREKRSGRKTSGNAQRLCWDARPEDVVLQDAGEMSLAQQTALLEWLDAAGDRRVITTTRQSLLPRVESGLFSSALYYRLNMITIDFTDTDTSVVS
jgi:hypothetical protein